MDRYTRVSTRIKGSQFISLKGHPVFQSLMGGYVLNTLYQALQIFLAV